MEITIRHSEPEDFAAIQAIYAQPSCFGGTLQLPYPSLDMWKKRLNNWGDDHFSLVAELNGQIVGQLGFEVSSRPRRKHAANFGMGVSEAHQGKGIGSKLIETMLDMAINWMQVKRIELEVYTDNDAAIALYKKHGFEIEGTARKHAFRDGQYVDTHFMAKLVP